MKQQDPWRYRCPEGHTTWARFETHYYCQHCEERFDRLTDWKTKEKVA